MTGQSYLQEALHSFPLEGKNICAISEKDLVGVQASLFSLETIHKAESAFFDAFFILHELKYLALEGKDFSLMKQAKRLLKKEGLLFLSIPVGKEKTIPRSYQVYNEERMKALFQGFRPVGYFGYSYEDLQKDFIEIHEPVFVLTNK